MRLAPATAALALSIALLSPGVAAEPASDRERALELYKESKALYREGRFQEAIDRLERAYALEPEPVLLYNLGRAHEGTGKLERAIEVYERYLREDPTTSDRGAIEARLETLRRQIAEREALQQKREPAPEREPEVPRQRPERPSKSGASAVPWVIAGAGAALLGAGVVLGLQARSREDEANDPERSALSASDKQRDAERFATLANVAFVTGGALAVGGTSWALIAAGDSSGEARLWLKGSF
jgi:tetratricopeptide (TPR) repeat protein